MRVARARTKGRRRPRKNELAAQCVRVALCHRASRLCVCRLSSGCYLKVVALASFPKRCMLSGDFGACPAVLKKMTAGFERRCVCVFQHWSLQARIPVDSWLGVALSRFAVVCAVNVCDGDVCNAHSSITLCYSAHARMRGAALTRSFSKCVDLPNPASPTRTSS